MALAEQKIVEPWDRKKDSDWRLEAFMEDNPSRHNLEEACAYLKTIAEGIEETVEIRLKNRGVIGGTEAFFLIDHECFYYYNGIEAYQLN